MFWLPGGSVYQGELEYYHFYSPRFGSFWVCNILQSYLQFTPSPFPPLASSWTNRILNAKDHASVQISVADVDPTTGKCTGTTNTFGMCVSPLPLGTSF